LAPGREREREIGGRRQSLRVTRQAFREWLVETIPDQVADLREVIEQWAPDVIVTDASMWGPSLVLRDSEPIPVALASPLIYAAIPGRDTPPLGTGMAPAASRRGRAVAASVTRLTELIGGPVRKRVDELRAGYGLPPMGCRVNEYIGALPLYMVLSVPELDYNRWTCQPACAMSALACGTRRSRPPRASGSTRSAATARGCT